MTLVVRADRAGDILRFFKKRIAAWIIGHIIPGKGKVLLD
jgi:hypothetical protein